jgi:hypothetical protein
MTSRPPLRMEGIVTSATASTKTADAQAPDERDIWQAASLFIGLYGSRALHVAATRLSELDEDARRDRQVWNRIIIKIGELLCASPALETH